MLLSPFYLLLELRIEKEVWCIAQSVKCLLFKQKPGIAWVPVIPEMSDKKWGWLNRSASLNYN